MTKRTDVNQIKLNILTKQQYESLTPNSNEFYVISDFDISDYLKTITGYNGTATQTLKNVNGVLTWVTD